MKRYSIRSTIGYAYAQFPANNKAEALECAVRHANHMDIEYYTVAYVGKWYGDDNPQEYHVKITTN